MLWDTDEDLILWCFCSPMAALALDANWVHPTDFSGMLEYAWNSGGIYVSWIQKCMWDEYVSVSVGISTIETLVLGVGLYFASSA